MYLRFFYSVPGERRRCPACYSRRIQLVDPLPLKKSKARRNRNTGFIAGCRACGILFANPMPTETELTDFYSLQGVYQQKKREIALSPARDRLQPRRPDGHSTGEETRHARHSHGSSGSRTERTLMVLAQMQAYVPVLAPLDGVCVLDFGCGKGKFLDPLQDRGWRTYGLEPSVKKAFRRHECTSSNQSGPMSSFRKSDFLPVIRPRRCV